MRVEFPGAIYLVVDRGDRREDILTIGTAKGPSPCSTARAVQASVLTFDTNPIACSWALVQQD
jgi:hypothetical protein